MTKIPYIKPESEDLDSDTFKLFDYQKKAMDDLYKNYIGSDMYSRIEPTQIVTTNHIAKPQNLGKTTVDSINKNIQMLYNQYVHNTTWDTSSYHYAPRLEKSESKLEVAMDNGKVETVTREELIKYICERKIVQENEVVRKVYERYQVAVKLVRSDDNGDSGV